jgi:hypothetical protein
MPLREIRRFLVDPRPELPADYARRLQYVSKTSNVRVDALDPFITGTIGELVAGRVDGPPFCVFHGRVNETDDGPVEVGVPRTDGDRRLPAARARRLAARGLPEHARRAGSVGGGLPAAIEIPA